MTHEGMENRVLCLFSDADKLITHLSVPLGNMFLEKWMRLKHLILKWF